MAAALRHRGRIIMREVQFITGVSRTELDEHVLGLLEDRIGADGVPRFLYLSPTLRKNRQMASQLREQRVSWRGGLSKAACSLAMKTLYGHSAISSPMKNAAAFCVL